MGDWLRAGEGIGEKQKKREFTTFQAVPRDSCCESQGWGTAVKRTNFRKALVENATGKW